jgi:RNA polymerase sigma factor (TIGR02999 family)
MLSLAMAERSRDEVTRLLQAIGRGEGGADDDLLRRIYAKLRGIAQSQLSGKPAQTLQATALVHEAYLRLLDRAGTTWENRRNFFFAASRAMHDVMVEQARRKAALERGRGWKRSELDDLTMVVEDPGVDVLALDEALKTLEETHPGKAELVRLRFFGGLSTSEAADVLGVSRRTVEREWRFIRARLHLQLAGVQEGEDASE